VGLPPALDSALGSPAADAAQAAGRPGPIRFSTDYEASIARAARTGKSVIVIFGAIWCTACGRFSEETLTDPAVCALRNDYHWVKLKVDWDLTLARAFGVSASPHVFVLGPDGAVLGDALGALDAPSFLLFLEEVRAHGELLREPGEELTPISFEDSRRTPLSWTADGYRGQSICFSHVGYGPLDLPSQAPAQVLRLGLRPRTPSTLIRGEFELRWTESVANIFAYRKDDYRLDYLTINSILSLAYGVSDSVLVEIEYSNLIRTGSYLDPITNAFHELFGLGDSGRSRFPDYENVIDLELKDGVEIEDHDSGIESGDITLTLQHSLTCGTETWPALSYDLSVRYHLGGSVDLEGSHPWSFGASMSAARRIGHSFYTYLGLGYTWHGLDEALGLPLVDEQWSSLLALEWRYRAHSSWVLQYLVSEGVARDRDPFDKPSNEINLGWKRELGSGLLLEIGLIENMIEVDNSPDFGIHFGLSKRF
jgi:hypothetical protein